MKLRLTRSGMLLPVLGAAFGAAGVLLRFPEVVVAGGALALTTVVGAVWAWVANRPISAERILLTRRVPEHEAAAGSLTLTNPTRRRRRIDLRDSIAGTSVPLALAPLPAGASAVIELRLPGLPRGHHLLGPLTLVAFDPLGLARTERSVGGTMTLRVHPHVHSVRSRGAHPGRAGLQQRGVSPDATELHYLDEYHAGDDPRLIHWPSSLRRGALMVRHAARDRDDTDTIVLLDTGAGSYRDDEQFEHAVRTAASVALAVNHDRELTRFVTTADPAGRPAARRTRTELLDELSAVQRSAEAPSLGDLPVSTARRPPSMVAVTGSGADLPVSLPHLARLAEAVTLLRIGTAAGAAGAGDKGATVTVIEAPTSDQLVHAWNVRSRG